jgi:hypothetical protein
MFLANSKILQRILFLITVVCLPVAGFCQRYLADLDSSLYIKDTVRPVLEKFENLRISGYMQPQYQVAQSDGAPSYDGGNFSQFSSSRFMLRRARLKVDYLLTTKNKLPKALFTFQIDATERGVIVRDMFIRLYETKKNYFNMTTGFFARPFGFEVNLGSSFRESPERGRMSQILMPGERDLGVMFSFDPLRKTQKLYHFKLDAGFFNGQGASGTTDFDSHKDFISRLTIRPFDIKKWQIGGGLSILRGGWKNSTKYVYNSGLTPNGIQTFLVDSSEKNYGRSSPRHYYGADVQLKLHHKWGETEWRAEYWFGTQPGTFNSTTNPGTLPLALPTYVRHFNGAFFYFIQNIINTKHQLLLKYDWYDPNIKVKENEIGVNGTNLSSADINFRTLALGYVYYFNPQTKIIFYYELVKNSSTQLAGYTKDLEDNVFTCRLQFRF